MYGLFNLYWPGKRPPCCGLMVCGGIRKNKPISLQVILRVWDPIMWLKYGKEQYWWMILSVFPMKKWSKNLKSFRGKKCNSKASFITKPLEHCYGVLNVMEFSGASSDQSLKLREVDERTLYIILSLFWSTTPTLALIFIIPFDAVPFA